MVKYRKKPVVVEAIIFTRNTWKEVVAFTDNTAFDMTIEKRMDGKCTCVIPTLEDNHTANEGDYIIRGVKGEFYPCKPDIFEMTYENKSIPIHDKKNETVKSKLNNLKSFLEVEMENTPIIQHEDELEIILTMVQSIIEETEK